MNDNIQKSCVKILGINTLGVDICAAAARISTTNGTALELYQKSVNNANNNKLINAVLASGHHSIMEHCYFNIAFNNVSVFVEQYIIEFRLASFTVQSRRYVDFSQVGFYTSSQLKSDLVETYNNHMKSLFIAYEELLHQGIPKEDARFVLPYCFHSNFFCSCNARELLHIICTLIYGRGSVFEELYCIGQQLAQQFEKYFPEEIKKHKHEYQFEKRESKRWVESISTLSCCPLPEIARSSVTLLSRSTLDQNEILNLRNYNYAHGPNNEYSDIQNSILSTRSRELELINISYLIRDISLASITHLVRHRIQTVLVPCVGDAIFRNKFIMPKTISESINAKHIYIQAVNDNRNVFNKMIANGMKHENSVYFALSGNTLDVVSSMNARELTHFLKLRLCNRAQWEIRKISEKMLKVSVDEFPIIFSYVGPSCFVTGKCPEGKKTCGNPKFRYNDIISEE